MVWTVPHLLTASRRFTQEALRIKGSDPSIKEHPRISLEIIARERKVDIGLRRIPLQDFTVGTNRVANAPLEFRHGSACVRKVEDFVPFYCHSER